MTTVMVTRDNAYLPALQKALASNEISSWSKMKLAYQLQKSCVIKSFHTLYALQYLPHLTLLDYQLAAAKKVLQDMNGRAILADEVGLGKTIEAGLILKEYMIRGLVKKALILVPATLVTQWVHELKTKFLIDVIPYKSGYHFADAPIYITTLELAKKEKYRKQIEQINYDLIIIDEAHKLNNEKTINFQFVNKIKKKYCLLLTATPVQNKISDIFNLITIIRPGLLGCKKTFQQQYGKADLIEKNQQSLQLLIEKVMIRNQRKTRIQNDVARQTKIIFVDLSPQEKLVYQQLKELFSATNPLVSLTYLKEFCSSYQACFQSIRKSSFEQTVTPILADLAEEQQHSKAGQLLSLIRMIGEEKIIIFTEYKATQQFLQLFLFENGIKSVTFSGAMSKSKKEWMQQLFAQQFQVFITTTAGSEGINLQFCHHLINYDLPWNPLKLEQRIGRVHRIGQKNDVQIYHLALQHTLEEKMIGVLYQKISLFENVIGELDHILTPLHGKNIDEQIKKWVMRSNVDHIEPLDIPLEEMKDGNGK